MIKRSIPTAIAVAVGLLTFIGLLLQLDPLSNLLLRWATFLVAVALLLGILNLYAVHLNRLFHGSGYSGILVLSMTAVFALAITDRVGLTSQGVDTLFRWIQAPLEAALAALLTFFLIFAGIQLLRRRRTIWMALFWATAVIILLTTAFTQSRFIPVALSDWIDQVHQAITAVFVTAGMRGILLGVALGTITLSVRLLIGAERPYNK